MNAVGATTIRTHEERVAATVAAAAALTARHTTALHGRTRRQCDATDANGDAIAAAGRRATACTKTALSLQRNTIQRFWRKTDGTYYDR